MSLLTQRQTALLLSVSESTLERMRCQGLGGPKWVRVGRRGIRYRLGDLEDYIASRVVSSTSEQKESGHV